MTDEAKLQFIKDIISNSDDLEPRLKLDEINLSTKFSEDMGFDSLAMMSLCYELQEKYPDLDESNLSQYETLNGLIKDLK